MCMDLLTECMSRQLMCAMPKEGGRGYQVPRDWRCRQLSLHVGAGKRTWVFWKSSRCS